MPLFIKAIPLSFKTFWRYLLLLPFLAIAAFVLSLAAFIPIAGMFVPGTIAAGLTIIGLRCALAARGHGNELDIGKLLIVSVIFCVINSVADLFIRFTGQGIVWGLGQVGVELDPIGLFVGLLGLSYYWSGMLLALLSPTALVAAAFAVPMTAAAASATPRGGDIKAFFGFGSGLLGLMFVMAVWLFSGRFFAIFGEIWTTFGLMATALWSWFQDEGLPWEISLDPWTAFASTIFMTWASSWFFATAVLTWERKVERQKADWAAQANENRVSTDELRALRKKRAAESEI
ncbi:hypothetical protein [Pseudaestuariivita rosea]|uniref:hypothetical protein n=1 Tax=Pseudaestuariivita rosea TaxID=2763263 RepID=UPI001ABA78A1|nr:hypothetical protein [Pseudaestuariivita rosea]